MTINSYLFASYYKNVFLKLTDVNYVFLLQISTKLLPTIAKMLASD